jgi:hypothetical protein
LTFPGTHQPRAVVSVPLLIFSILRFLFSFCLSTPKYTSSHPPLSLSLSLSHTHTHTHARARPISPSCSHDRRHNSSDFVMHRDRKKWRQSRCVVWYSLKR